MATSTDSSIDSPGDADSNGSSSDSPRVQRASLEKYRPYLRLLADANIGSVLRKRIDASDLVQQVMLKAHENRSQFRGHNEAMEAAWLRQILRNTLIDFARFWQGAKRDARRDVVINASIDESMCRVDEWLAASASSPSQNVAKLEQLIRLPTALDQLTDKLRDVIVMHHLRGMKLREIALELKCDETTVGRRLMRGLKQLHSIMDT